MTKRFGRLGLPPLLPDAKPQIHGPTGTEP